jgi:hypothetical protein
MAPPIHQSQRMIRAIVFAAAASVTCLLFINFCDLVYQCGCVSWWAGAADHCNIHAASPPHCPWCANALAGYSSFAAIIAAQALAAFVPGAWGAGRRLALALAAFPATGAVMAVLSG